MKTKQFIFIVAAIFLFLTMHSQKGYCQWVDQSDDLPGTTNITPYLIAGGVVITGAITYLIIRKNKKKQSTSYSIKNQPGNLSTGSFYTENDSFYDKMKKASQQATVEFFAGNFNSNAPMAYNANTGLSVGLRFKF